MSRRIEWAKPARKKVVDREEVPVTTTEYRAVLECGHVQRVSFRHRFAHTVTCSVCSREGGVKDRYTFLRDAAQKEG